MVIRGAPNDLSITTLRPFGPRVTFTALASTSTPRSMRSRASVWNLTSFAAISSLLDRQLVDCIFALSGGYLLGGLGLDDSHDIAFLHDQEIFAVDLDLGAGPLAEQDAVAHLDVERLDLTLFAARAGTYSEDFAFLGLLLGSVGDDDAAFGLLFGLTRRTRIRS